MPSKSSNSKRAFLISNISFSFASLMIIRLFISIIKNISKRFLATKLLCLLISFNNEPERETTLLISLFMLRRIILFKTMGINKIPLRDNSIEKGIYVFFFLYGIFNIKLDVPSVPRVMPVSK